MDNNGYTHKSMEQIYEELTGIHIDDQLKEWDARGKGYYGEYLLFRELYNHVPGKCKILMNLQIPAEYGRTTEIDLLLIHETGLYVFEAKHYKGTIYGKVEDQRWTQYFRTVKNNSFQSPILQNRWHIEQLRKLYPYLPIHSFIVFTSDECRLEVKGQLENTTLCYQRNVCECLARVTRLSAERLSMERIDEVFRTLKEYSPIREVSVKTNEVTLNLYDFLEHISNYFSTKKQELQQRSAAIESELQLTYADKEKELQRSYAQKEKELQRKAKLTKILAAVICAAVVILSFGFSASIIAENKANTQEAIYYAEAAIAQCQENCDAQIKQYQDQANAAQKELEQFKQKWEVVADFQIDGTMVKKDFVLIDQVKLENSRDLTNRAHLSCVLTHNGEEYYVLIDKNSMFTVVLHDGRVLEYPCYSSPYYSYSLGYSSNYKTLEIKNEEFSGFSAQEVKYIKLTNLQIKRIKLVWGEQPLLTDYEILLYSAE